MESQHYLHKAIRSLDTYIILTKGCHRSKRALDLMKNMDQVDPEAIGSPERDDEPTIFDKLKQQKMKKSNCLECGELVDNGDNYCHQCYFNNGFDQLKQQR